MLRAVLFTAGAMLASPSEANTGEEVHNFLDGLLNKAAENAHARD